MPIEPVGTGVAGDGDPAADTAASGEAAAADVGDVMPGPVAVAVADTDTEGEGDAEVAPAVGALDGDGDGDGDGCGPAARSTCSKRIFAADPK